tara:strand:- start:497 stop:760 length:264 start_codon:yes stop_codon:yes gene_type:complete
MKKEDNKMTRSKTIFVEANNGGIQLYVGPGNSIGTAKTAEALNELINKNNLSGSVHFGSSMDFASEYGFKNNDGAFKLWDQLEELRG